VVIAKATAQHCHRRLIAASMNRAETTKAVASGQCVDQRRGGLAQGGEVGAQKRIVYPKAVLSFGSLGNTLI